MWGGFKGVQELTEGCRVEFGRSRSKWGAGQGGWDRRGGRGSGQGVGMRGTGQFDPHAPQPPPPRGCSVGVQVGLGALGVGLRSSGWVVGVDVKFEGVNLVGQTGLWVQSRFGHR